MSWLKSLFVSDKNLGKLTDAAISAGDKLWFTEEEKADYTQKVRAWYLDLLAAMKPFNVAMRILAIGVFGMWAFHVCASTVSYVAAFFICEAGQEVCKMADLGTQLEIQMNKHINPHFGKIIMFYFGAAATVSGITAFKQK